MDTRDDQRHLLGHSVHRVAAVMTRERFVGMLEDMFGTDLEAALIFTLQSRRSQTLGWKLMSLERDFVTRSGEVGWGGVLRDVATAYEAAERKGQ